MPRCFVIALLGAESTGKTTLARELHATLATPRRRVKVVDEYLREFCTARGRTPHPHEQQGIADEQTRRILEAAHGHDLVIADTTALMTAVYSELMFGDTRLHASALAAHARCDLTLLTALDLPWQADGLQRDGPEVREPVDARVRVALGSAALGYAVIAGLGPTRCRAALGCVQRALNPPAPDAPTRWHWHCERCGDADCDRHSLLPPTSR